MKGKLGRVGSIVLTVTAAAGGVLLMEGVKYSAGRESWLFSGWNVGWRPDVSASLDSGGRVLVIDPGAVWHDPTITLYTGSVAWTHSVATLEDRAQRIPLVQFADSDGNRFKPDEKKPQRLRIRGIVSVPVEQPDGGMIARPRELTIDRILAAE